MFLRRQDLACSRGAVFTICIMYKHFMGSGRNDVWLECCLLPSTCKEVHPDFDFSATITNPRKATAFQSWFWEHCAKTLRSLVNYCGWLLISCILHSWNHEGLQFVCSLFYQLTGGHMLGTNSFCLTASLLLTRSWSDPEGPRAFLVHGLPKQIRLAHQDAHMWTEVSCRGSQVTPVGQSLWD